MSPDPTSHHPHTDGLIAHIGVAVPVSADRYLLGEEIARGGMGAVYRVTDTNLDRDLAVKVLLADAGRRPDLVRRFESEAKLTAGLQHPGVVPIHEVGALADGRPFYAMKLVRGKTLAELLATRLAPADDLPKFLDVFLSVCRTVAYAHSRGVIHRDLKPLNVMVGDFGEVQVMDWGLAKVLVSGGRQAPVRELPVADTLRSPDDTKPPALDPNATTDPHAAGDTPDATRAGSVMGTPAYMPPEQARGEVDRVDRQSDVFALGAILCEVLTGTPPYGSGSRGAVMGRAAAGDLTPAREALAGCGADSELLNLAARCLAADANDRPDDAGEVAGLVEAYRAGVEDRLRKAQADRAAAEATAREQAKRRQVALRLGSAVLGAVLLGGGAAAWQAVRATNAAFAEGQAREAEAKASADAKASEAKAIRDRDTAEEVAEFMQIVFAGEGTRGVAGRNRDFNKKRTVKEAMDQAAKEIVGRFGDRPEVEAAVRNTIGMTYYDLGAYADAQAQVAQAVALREAALGPDHRDTLKCVNNLAMALHALGDSAAAEPLFRRALIGAERDLGPDHAETLITVGNLAAVLHQKGDLAAAEPLARRALAGTEAEFGPDHYETLATVNNLAFILTEKEDHDAAEPLLRRALAGLEKALGPDHPDTLLTVNNLGLLLERRRDYAAAEPLFRRALAGQERALGPDHPHTLATVNNLAAVLKGKGDLTAAEPLYRRALAGRDKIYGPDHSDTLTCVHNLATLLGDKGEVAAAEPLFRRVLAGRERVLGPEHPDTLQSMFSLAFLFQQKLDYASAEPLYRRALAGRERVLGPDHRDTLQTTNNLGFVLHMMGDLAAAEPLYRRAMAGLEAARGPDHPGTVAAVTNLGNLLQATGDLAAAEPLLVRAVSNQEKIRGPDHLITLGSVNALAMVYVDQRRYADAVPLLDRAARGYARRTDVPGAVPSTRAALGLALLADGKPTEAEPHLLAAHDGLGRLKILSDLRRNRLRWAAAGLVEVYERTNQPDKANEWRAKLAKLPPEVAPPPRPVR